MSLDDRAERYSARLQQHDSLRFVPLPELNPGTPRTELLRRAEVVIHQAEADGRAAGIIGDLGLPVTLLLPLLRQPLHLPGPRLESVLQCEHKYWSRLIQHEALPGYVPRFSWVDPFAREPGPSVAYPVYIKPVSAVGGHVAHRVCHDREWDAAIEALREQLPHDAELLDELMSGADVPEEIRAVSGRHCLVEEAAAGRQCTLEGYVSKGRVCIYAFIDCIRAPNKTTVLRYQYPSNLPEEIRRELATATACLVKRIDLDDSPFNVEYLVDDKRGQIRLIEINPTIERAHADLFFHVHGTSHHDVAIALALGEAPQLPEERAGRYRHAAHCFFRHFEDGQVIRTPHDKELDAIRRDIPGVDVVLAVHPGDRLARLPFQDGHSYTLASISIGAKSQRELLRKLRHTQARLRIDIEPVG